MSDASIRGERLRSILADLASANRAETLRDVFLGVWNDLGEADDRVLDWSGWAEELAALDARPAGDEYGEEFLIAALAVAAARHIFPNSAQPDGGARFARLLSHRAGYSPDITESAVALARYCHVPTEDDPVISKLLVASLIVDMPSVARTAELFGVDTARFRQRCCALDCWDRPFEPTGIPEEASPHVRRRAVEAVVERHVPVDEVEAYARSLASDTIGHMIVTVGIPGAGKTTWVERVLGSVPIVSTDRLRGVLLGDATDQSRNGMIISRSIAAAESIAASGRTVVFDATNTNHCGRERIRRALRRSGARSTMVYFDTSLDEALRRNMIRPRAVPDEVIRKFYRRLEAPRPDEADTTVIVSNVWDQPRIRKYGRELRIRDAIPVKDVGAYLR